MITKILYLKKNGPLFPGVRYNTNKADRNKGELMKVANFGALQGLSNLRPQDYINYLRSLAALNPAVSKPQFHAVISGKGKLYDKNILTAIAEKWMKEMGYGEQPYIITYHKDTENEHVHIVSSRIDRHGEKIDSAFEKVRAQRNMEKVLGYDYAFGYRFCTRAQFFMLLENAGYPGLDPDEQKIAERIDKYQTDPQEIARIRELLLTLGEHPDRLSLLKDYHGLELLFHAAEGKQPYGYSIIDHEHKIVYKGSQVLALKQWMAQTDWNNISSNAMALETRKEVQPESLTRTTHIQSVWIADDVDDQQIHGMRRRRQKKARTNTR